MREIFAFLVQKLLSLMFSVHMALIGLQDAIYYDWDKVRDVTTGIFCGLLVIVVIIVVVRLEYYYRTKYLKNIWKDKEEN